MAGAESGRDRGSRREVRSGLARLGHRKIAAMMRADGHQVSTSTVQRAPGRRGLLLPTGLRADRRSWARLRKRVFQDPPRQQNRVWQMDCSQFQTARGGIWRSWAVIDDATKDCLAATSPRRLAARMRWVASAGPLSRPKGSWTSTTPVPTAA
jgi:transposase-like protein